MPKPYSKDLRERTASIMLNEFAQLKHTRLRRCPIQWWLHSPAVSLDPKSFGMSHLRLPASATATARFEAPGRSAHDCRLGLTRRPTAASQWRRWRGALGRLYKEFRNVNVERSGKAIKHVDGRVFLPPLKTTDVGAVDAPIKGEPFLREASRGADSPQVPCHQRASLHAAKAATLRAIKPLVISRELCLCRPATNAASLCALHTGEDQDGGR